MRRGKSKLPKIEGLDDPSPDELRSAMIAELRDTPAPICVLSGEGLFGLRAKDVENLAACLRPTIDQINDRRLCSRTDFLGHQPGSAVHKKANHHPGGSHDPSAVAA